MGGQHSIYAPSVLGRLAQCPYSINFARYPGFDNPDSAKGTSAHEVARDLAADGYTKTEDPALKVWEKVVKDHFDLMSEGAQVCVELTLNYPWIHQECYGTPDLSILDSDRETVTVMDYKNGVGIEIDPKTSIQIRAYSYGEVKFYQKMYGKLPKTLVRVIVQPNAIFSEPVKTSTIKGQELLDFISESEAILGGIIKATLKENPTIKSGKECRYCPGLPFCPLLNDITVELPKLKEGPTKTELGQLAETRKRLKEFAVQLKGLDEFALGWMSEGKQIPGLKVTRSAGRRTWKDSKELQSNYPPEHILKPAEIDTPAGLEKRYGKKDFEAMGFKEFVTKKEGGLQVKFFEDKGAPVDFTDGFEELK